MSIVSLSEKISLKHAAELAGMGMIGRNHLLINGEYGNLLWFSAVLTDAELTPDKKIQLVVCDDCDICVKACPAGALSDPGRFGRKECSKIMMRLLNGKMEISCFQCRKACPHRFGTGHTSKECV
jgi:epoxyqueuosine reductase QueG